MIANCHGGGILEAGVGRLIGTPESVMFGEILKTGANRLKSRLAAETGLVMKYSSPESARQR
jgi:hypothetical protein